MIEVFLIQIRFVQQISAIDLLIKIGGFDFEPNRERLALKDQAASIQKVSSSSNNLEQCIQRSSA